MAQRINNKLDIVVTGIENASKCLNNKRKNISVFENNYPKKKRRKNY